MRLFQECLENTADNIGLLHVLHDGTCLRGVYFADRLDQLSMHLRRWYDDCSVEKCDSSALTSPLADYLSELRSGRRQCIERAWGCLSSLSMKPRGTAHQQRVWAGLRQIPLGETISYQVLADNIGNPKACRAVGTANGANPISIAIPCHRVIAADGTLGGYGGGLMRKSWLLGAESHLA